MRPIRENMGPVALAIRSIQVIDVTATAIHNATAFVRYPSMRTSTPDQDLPHDLSFVACERFDVPAWKAPLAPAEGEIAACPKQFDQDIEEPIDMNRLVDVLEKLPDSEDESAPSDEPEPLF